MTNMSRTDRALAALAGLVVSDNWPPYSGGEPEYGPAQHWVVAAGRLVACQRCGGPVRSDGPGWATCADRCADPVDDVMATLALPAGLRPELLRVLARTRPPAYRRMPGATPDRPVRPWSFLPAARGPLTAHLDRHVRRGPPAGADGGCWYCGRARSTRWLLDRGGRWSCGDPLCQATSSGLLRARARVLRDLCWPDWADPPAVTGETVGVLDRRMAAADGPVLRLWGEHRPGERPKPGRPWAWISAADVERWRQELTDIADMFRDPDGYAARREARRRAARQVAAIDARVDARVAALIAGRREP